MNATSVEVEQRGTGRYLWLNRAECRNAFNAVTIAELSAAVQAAAADDTVRVVVLAARGRLFCAGGDIKWMQDSALLSRADNRADAEALARLLYAIYSCPKPVIARVQGDCYGGGVGLVAACDIVIATPATQFCLSEVRLGLIPATVAPYVIRAIGTRAASRYMLTAEHFSASEAQAFGLVHQLSELAVLDAAVALQLQHFAQAGPEALRQTKKLIDALVGRRFGEEVIADTAARIADVRASAEAREGMQAFLAHRKPAWAVADSLPAD